MGILGIDHVQLAAPTGCEVEARRLYGEVLGLVEVAKPERLRARGGVWFSLGAQQLHIGVDENFLPARTAHSAVCVATGELKVVADRLARSGAKVTWDHSLPDVRRFYTEDPWGQPG